MIFGRATTRADCSIPGSAPFQMIAHCHSMEREEMSACNNISCPLTACIGVGCTWHPMRTTPFLKNYRKIEDYTTDDLLAELRRRVK